MYRSQDWRGSVNSFARSFSEKVALLRLFWKVVPLRQVQVRIAFGQHHQIENVGLVPFQMQQLARLTRLSCSVLLQHIEHEMGRPFIQKGGQRNSWQQRYQIGKCSLGQTWLENDKPVFQLLLIEVAVFFGHSPATQHFKCISKRKLHPNVQTSCSHEI